MSESGNGGEGRLRQWSGRAVVGLLGLAGVTSLVTLAETNVWWVRYVDFTRLQFIVAMLMLLLVLGVLRPRLGALGIAALALAVLGLAYHLYRVYPYVPPFPRQAVAADTCPDSSRLRLMVANVQRDNEVAAAFTQLVSRVQPDVLVVMETDRWWDQHLAPLRDVFAHAVQAIPKPDSYFGMHVFSRYELVSPDVEYLFGLDTPMIRAGLRMPDGRVARLFAMHPRPPQAWSQPTTARDGQLMKVALEVRGSKDPVVLAGDFNAVPWERTMRRALRVGELLDPRVGRGFMPTFEVGSVLKSWPLDAILFSTHFTLLEFRRLPPFGSDHYAIAAQLCVSEQAAAHQQPPVLQPQDMREAQAAIAAAAALAN